MTPRALLLAATLAALAPAAGADTVTLQGMLGKRALLIVNGTAPKTVAPGESHMGVKVLSTDGDQAVVEVAGQRRTLRVGDVPANVGGAPSAARGSRIVLSAATDGHFTTPGTINGRPVNFLVDTGATSVSMSVAEAERIGLNYKDGQPGRSSTANGIVPTWRIRLASVRIGDVEVFDVDATVLPAGMPYILLGNTFLTRFQIKLENSQMVMERRY